MDDEDSLLERIAEVDNLEEEEEDDEVVKSGSPEAEAEALDYNEDPEDGEEGEEKEEASEDGEIEEKAEKSDKEDEEEKEDGELEDGELEDSDDGEIKDDEPQKRAPITAPAGSARRPIEVGSSMNDNRISRPMGRQLPPIRNHPYVPRREDPGTVSWEAALLAAKRAVNGREDAEADRGSTSPTDPDKRAIPSLLDIRTHKPQMKDLGPQVIYPNRAPPNPSSSQNRFKRDSAPSAPARDAPMFRGRTISQRQAPPQITRRNSSKSPPARGISYSPSKFDAHEISSDTDEEAMQKRPPRERKITLKKAKRSSSVSSSTSEATIPGARDISTDSSDAGSSSRRRRARRRSHRSRSRTYSTSSDRGSSSKRSRQQQHMKRKTPSSPSRRSRSRSPPPYPPGHDKKMFQQKKKRQDSVVTGDIHAYRIPKRSSSGRDSQNSSFFSKNGASSSSRSQIKRSRQRSETPPMVPSAKRRKDDQKQKLRRGDTAGGPQNISGDSDDSASTFDSRRGKRISKIKRNRRSPSKESITSRSSSSSSSSRSRSRSSHSDSSDSSSSKLPSRYRQKLPTEQEKISSDEDEPAEPIAQKAAAPVSPNPASSRSASPEPAQQVDELLESEEAAPPPPPPPPPENEPEEFPPPPPSISIRETKKQLKMRLKSINKMLEIQKSSPLLEGNSSESSATATAQ